MASRRPKQDPESLRWALELAVRSEDYEAAQRLRDELPEAEMERPTTALEGLVRDRVRRAVDVGLGRASPEDSSATSSTATPSSHSLDARLEAVRLLQVLATPPAAFQEAEDGLFCILREGEQAEVVEAAEASLWSSWLPSGDETVDLAMRQGLKLMGAGELNKAVQAFSEAVDMAPAFAEGWNKRATALFLAERIDESIEDCKRVLALKPRHFGCLSGLGICLLRKGDERTAARWLRQALDVNPRSSDMQRVLADLEARAAFAVLKPRLKEALADLRDGRPHSLPEDFAHRKGQVRTAWDACRVEDLEKFTYYFRVSVECLAGPRVSGAARYYALKHAGGTVFPLSRVTQGPAAFSLGPGESYRYSFMLTLAEELLVAQGGLLLRSGEDLSEAILERITLGGSAASASFLPVSGGCRVRGVREADLSRLNDGYHFMGRLEIQVED